MPNVPQPPRKDDARFDDWIGKMYRDGFGRQAWTPSITFATPGNLSVAYATGGREGELYSFGGLYVARFFIVTSTFTHTTASGNLSITGLPRTAVNDSAFVGWGPLQFQGITLANYSQWTPYIVGNTDVIKIAGSGSGQNNVTLSASHMPTAGTVILGGSVLFR